MKAYPRLTHYRIIKELTEGTHSTVYVAETASGAQCAVKIFRSVLRKEDEPGSGASRFYLSELEVLSTCNHPNLIRLLDFGQVQGTGDDFLALEWFQGKDFVSASLAATRPQFYSMLAQVCSGLDYLHSRGLVHGDLKPQNLLVSSQSASDAQPPIVKLLDFGYSTFSCTTARQYVQGSPQYMAPEVIQGFPPTFASDLYSFGVILYECLTGTPPFSGGSVADILRHHVLHKPPPITNALSADLHPLVYQLLSKDPDRRPASALEVIRLICSASSHNDTMLDSGDLWYARTSVPSAPSRLELHSQLRQILLQALRISHPTRPTLIMIIGSRGFGKTRILKELAIHARTLGFDIQLTGFDPSNLRGTCNQSWPALDHDTERPRPVLLAHDTPTLDQLMRLPNHFASPSSTRGPLVIAISLDPAFAPKTRISHLIEYLGRSFAILEYTLKPFDPGDVLAILRSTIAATTVQTDVIEYAVRTSGGHPEVLVRLLASMLQCEALDNRQGCVTQMRDLSHITVSPSLTNTLTGISNSLSVTETRIATLLAASPHNAFTEAELSSLTNIDPTSVIALCERLMLLNVLIRREESPPGLIIPGDLLRTTLLESLSEIQIRELHRVLGNWYVSHHDGQENLRHAAYHFRWAGMRDDTLTCALKAAERAMEHGDHKNAECLYRWAIECRPSDPQTLARAVLGQSQALTNLGQFSESAAALNTLVPKCHLLPDLSYRIESARALAAGGAGDFYLMEEASRAALRISHESGLTNKIAEASLRLGTALCNLERTRSGMPLLFRSAAKAQVLRQRDTKADALGQIAACYWKAGDYRRALGYQRRSAKLRIKITSEPHVASDLTRIGILQCDLGFFGRARRTHAQAQACARNLQRRSWDWIAGNNIGETFRAQGRWRKALGAYLHARDSLKGSGAS